MNTFTKIETNNLDEFKEIASERLITMSNLPEFKEKFVMEKRWEENDEVDLDGIDNDSKKETLSALNSWMWYISNESMEKDKRKRMIELIEEANIFFIPSKQEKESKYNEVLDELAKKLIKIDCNEKELMQQTKIKVTVMSNMTSAINLQRAIEAILKKYLKKEVLDSWHNIPDNEEKMDKYIDECEVLKELFKSQGYEIKDLADEKKVNDSIFLKSFIEEIKNNKSVAETYLTVLIETNVYDYIENFIESNKKLIIQPCEKLNLGLFNLWDYSSSNLKIALEKEIIISIKNTVLQIEEKSRNYGYTIRDVYGTDDDFYWTDQYVLV